MRAARSAGFDVHKVEIDKEGKIVVVIAPPDRQVDVREKEIVL